MEEQDKRQGYPPTDCDDICAGGYLPNAVEVEAATMLNHIAAHTFKERHGWGRHPGSSIRNWAHFFLIDNQGGGLTGEGYAVVYSGGWDSEAKRYTGGKAYRFAICKHEHVTHGDANPQRGWLPGHCAKCGLNMTVDSGD